jgi:chemotaxis signal transduction protein
MSEEGRLADRVAELRTAFDRGFAEAPLPAHEEAVSFLRIRLAAHAYVVALSEVAAVLADKPITPIPSAAQALLGVVAHRGDVVPVFSLRGLLGHGADERPRWLLLAGAERKAGFAFDGLDGHLRLAATDIAPAQPGAFQRHVRASVRIADELCPILAIASLMAELNDRIEAT